jgi:hypothetical protein
MLDKTVFLTLVRSSEEKKAAELLIGSLRRFGGLMGNSPIWVFTVNPEDFMKENTQNDEYRVIELPQDGSFSRYPFMAKVRACALAEEMARDEIDTMIWIDSSCLVVLPPLLFMLEGVCKAAVRPVHVTNVGLLADETPNGYWRGVFNELGIDDIDTAVETFVDARMIKSYFNTHAFSINPSEGLMRDWLHHFHILATDTDYQRSYCSDPLHAIFLHQAVFSALLASSLEASELRLLPADYNYPYNLHESVPEDRKVTSINETVCFAYEKRSVYPPEMTDVEVREPLYSWLTERER